MGQTIVGRVQLDTLLSTISSTTIPSISIANLDSLLLLESLNLDSPYGSRRNRFSVRNRTVRLDIKFSNNPIFCLGFDDKIINIGNVEIITWR